MTGIYSDTVRWKNLVPFGLTCVRFRYEIARYSKRESSESAVLKKNEAVNTTVAINFYIDEVNLIIIGRSRDLWWRKFNEFYRVGEMRRPSHQAVSSKWSGETKTQTSDCEDIDWSAWES